jgi:ribosomal protein S18 acetylase RimI-like enzyme
VTAAFGTIRYEVDAVAEGELHEPWKSVWGREPHGGTFSKVLAASLGNVCARYDGKLIGFVNVASDGGEHAFLLDTAVHPRYRRRGIGTTLVQQAIALAKERGACWLHVDFEPQYAAFYRRCGFRPTEAGLIALR